MNNVKFELNKDGGAEILQRNQNLKTLLNQQANSILSDAISASVGVFGEPLNLVLEEKSGGDRGGFKISAGDARSGALLKTQPKWLASFIVNI